METKGCQHRWERLIKIDRKVKGMRPGRWRPGDVCLHKPDFYSCIDQNIANGVMRCFLLLTEQAENITESKEVSFHFFLLALMKQML